MAGDEYYWREDIHGRVRVASLFSGGKDSTYALYVAQQRGWEVSGLVTLVPEDPESRLYHVPNIHLTPLLSECLAIPLTQKAANLGEAGEIGALKAALDDLDVDGVITGAVASEYQKSRIDGVCHELGLRCFSPLWRRDQMGLLEDYLLAGFRIMIVGAAAEGGEGELPGGAGVVVVPWSAPGVRGTHGFMRRVLLAERLLGGIGGAEARTDAP